MENGSLVSKVAVEYFDPSGVFPLISRQLQSLLPLRDLHWKSPTRPLRSIHSLHVDLQAAKEPDRPGSKHGAQGLDRGSAAGVPGERRHQIPGLRQTPYLKIFFLRCDDNESYRATARKDLRDWLKSHTPASQSSSSRNSQENHDAFEWLIVHVVLPNTNAAGQPRSSGSYSKFENVAAEKSASSSKLLGRGSSTILEKIKADFNISSKSAPDRVVQIRLRPDDLPAELVPPRTPSTGPDYQESAQERSNAWQELVSKLKILILSSFTLRVSQYEDDIRERESQKALPGWNFCTFFMLKEGLARGFESVGLVEDALVVYDELSVGLENTVEGDDEDRMSTRSDSFLKYTKEMKDILLQSLTSDSTSDVVWDSDTPIVSTSRKDYRNLIVNSNVSLLDFQCYIFARQMSILLRMGTSHVDEEVNPGQGGVMKSSNLAPFSELCQRCALFISKASRTLKTELIQASRAQGIDSPMSLVDNIIASFAFAVAQQVLEVTDVSSLTKTHKELVAGGHHQTMERLQHPVRRSSLQPSVRSTTSSYINPIALLKDVEEKLSQQPVGDETRMTVNHDVRILAGNRADLLFLQRQITEKIASKNGWTVGISSLTKDEKSYSEVDLEHNPDQEASRLGDASNFREARGILVKSLLEALASASALSTWYEDITQLILEQCALALRLKTSQRLVVDLAILRYNSNDFSTAATYLSRVLPSFSNHSWSRIGTELAKLHSRCLRKLNKKDDFVRTTLGILSKDIHMTSSPNYSVYSFDPVHTQVSHDLLEDVISVSQDLPCEAIFPLTDFFDHINIGPFIHHLSDQDGFELELKIRYLLHVRLPADVVRIKLRCVDPPFQVLWLEPTSVTTFVPGINQLKLRAKAICTGFFTVEKLLIQSKKLSFETDLTRTEVLDIPMPYPTCASEEGQDVARRPQILCYSTDESLSIEIEASRDIHIDKARFLDIVIYTGRNEIQKGHLHIKAGSAGLRLMVADAMLVRGEATIVQGKGPGTLELANLAAQSTITIRLPYDLESHLPKINIGLECTYTTPAGTFKFLSSPSIAVDLMLDVSVHDLFRETRLYSRFQIRASKSIPLLVTSVKLQDSDRYHAEAPPCNLMPLLVFPKQEGSILYIIEPKTHDGSARQSYKNEEPLQLHVSFLPLNELIFEIAEKSMLQALRKTRLGFLTQFVRNAIIQPLRHLDGELLEEAALLGEICLPEPSHMGWNEVVECLEPGLRHELGQFLRQWHEDNRLIALDTSASANAQHRVQNISINVPLPDLHVLHTAKLSLPGKSVVTHGSVIPVIVTVTYTRRWWNPSSVSPSTDAADHSSEFLLEIDAPPDVWLLGGQRRARYSASEGQETRFELMLVPLKTGKLLLPEVTIRPSAGAMEDNRCETDYRSLGETVHVVANASDVTIGLNETSNGTEVVLMGSRRRQLE
ncbi:uncharacterized protein PV09_08436 [Verruconis gallopava]|uniref:Trafficking protein particle complex subunit 11 domain-containing protein n=1 Tax=Verruconis gallopava TaxID=253628 RepID=A0A0D2A0T5_9PEZI|nr:uncharacterized protein PV09_08436 [Verruconis gallopava]KIV99909.1 hypothetical protein PV09_08436 [Verruconis gallopava]